jgi:hypothetical protein
MFLKPTVAALCATLSPLAPVAGRAALVGAASVGALVATQAPSHAQLPYGWHDLGNGYSAAVMTATDARAYADILTATSPLQDRINRMAQVLIRYVPGSVAWSLARILCYNGLAWALKLRINWCASRASRVYIYHRWHVPFYADPA